MPRPFARGTRFVSPYEVTWSMDKLKRRNDGLQSPNLCGAGGSVGRPHYPSRPDDIFRGLAKLKALEAATPHSAKKNDV